ncbi:CTD kinase subunit gamma [Apiospora hydei]|uniref:CTD kinase subunit gamma n=1 Tax=Apiospora hydei TaxID=1337664 RepID=A0ABR1V5V2_9PEZI
MPPPAPSPPPKRSNAGRNNRARRRAAKWRGRKKSKDSADLLSPSPSSPSFSSQAAPQPANRTGNNPTFVTGSNSYHDHINESTRPLQQQEQERPRVISVEEAYGPGFYGSKELGFCYLHPSEQAFWHIGNEAAQRLVLGPDWNIDAANAPSMADPFEVRMRFSGQLQHLNATVVSAQKAAQYAVKYRDLSEDLHSCILEQLEKTNMNTRANIMYFIEHFLEIASKERHAESYVRMMQRDIIRVVDAVCPEDGSGAANVKVVRTVLQGLNGKGFLLDQTLTELEECLKDRDASQAEAGLSSPVNGDAVMSTALPANGNAAANTTTAAAAGHSSGDARTTNGTGHTTRLDKRQIEQRIEEDRERHKRRRENLWVVPRSQVDERAKIMDDASEVDDDDFKFEREERAALMDEVENVKCVHLRPRRQASPNGREHSRGREHRRDDSIRNEDRDHDRMDEG